MSQTVKAVDKNICTGCGACRNICPINAIEMKPDSEGFLCPEIIKDVCIECGRCYSICPSVQPVNKPSARSKIFAAYYDDEARMKSSSGGVFTALAKYAFSKGGSVVGAAWTEEHRVKHIIINDESNLDRLRRSKYMQSEIGDTFRKVKELLDKQSFVLFSGCPCQVAGLYAYLGKKPENLLTVDIVCHGVPSPLAFENYLKDIAQGREVTDINFRDKSRGWGSTSNISFSDGTKYYKGCNDDPYYIAFLNGISTRPSCGTCKYASPVRIGDITLGDFWGVSEIDPSYNDNKGTNLVMLNSLKGEKIFEEIKDRFNLVREVPFDAAIELAKRRNGQLIAPRPSHKNRNRFFKLMEEDNFSKAVAQAAERKFDIGIVGWWYNENYGGTLTYFALNRILKSMGYSVLMIEKPSGDPNYKPNYSTIPRRFAKKYYNISKNYHPNKMGVLNGLCDTFISGSDQLFSPYLWEYSGPPYYLDFAAPNKNIISYASSFGNSYEGSEKFKMTVSYYLHRFNSLSVREDYGVEIMRDNFGLDAKKVLDPVFVCDPTEYDKLIEQSTVEIKEKYFASFILDPDEQKRNSIVYIGKQLGLPYVNLIHAMDFEQNTKKLGLENVKANADIEDFLKYYKNAEFIITDSFHGTCFAIIFRKPFISIANKQRGTGRFISMLGELGLEDRMVYDASEIQKRPELLQPIDYLKTESILRTLKDDSYNWLKNAIAHPASKAKNEFQLMDMKQNINVNRMILMQQEIDELKRRVEQLNKMLENR